MLLALIAAQAQVTPVGPFVGDRTETFDDHPATQGAIPCVEGAFGGLGGLCATQATVGGMQVRPALALGCEQTARSAPHLASSNDGPVELVTGAALDRFGGWFGTQATSGGELTIELYAADGSLLHAETSAFGGACQWTWRGWASAGDPIARVRIARTTGNGALVTLDDLQLGLACGEQDLDCDGSPAAQDCDDLDPTRAPGLTELCDGVDNDCDGQVPADELDGDGDGWLACEDCDDADPARHPGASDPCDGIDDDCDGVDGSNPPHLPPATRSLGVCAGATQVCVDGAWAEPDYAAIPGFEAHEQSCDGLDNDCDGQVDQGLVPPPVGGGLGVCALLIPTCEGPAGWVEPADWAAVGWEAVETRCDGLDNDCDGQVDEDGPLADLQLGVCEGARQVCTEDGWLEPRYADLPDFDPVEICDDLDNDCDGQVDEDCVRPKRGGLGCATGPGSLALGWLALAVLRRRAR